MAVWGNWSRPCGRAGRTTRATSARKVFLERWQVFLRAPRTGRAVAKHKANEDRPRAAGLGTLSIGKGQAGGPDCRSAIGATMATMIEHGGKSIATGFAFTKPNSTLHAPLRLRTGCRPLPGNPRLEPRWHLAVARVVAAGPAADSVGFGRRGRREGIAGFRRPP